MKILIPIKRVNDYNVKVRPNQANTDVDLSNVKMAVNPFCEIAIEEAVRLKEAGTATEVIAVTVGKSDSQEQLRTALALGADRAILVETDSLRFYCVRCEKHINGIAHYHERQCCSVLGAYATKEPAGIHEAWPALPSSLRARALRDFRLHLTRLAPG